MSHPDTCPVCGFSGILQENDHCTQCDADLTCFKVLDSLTASLPANETPGTSAGTMHTTVASSPQTGPNAAMSPAPGYGDRPDFSGQRHSPHPYITSVVLAAFFGVLLGALITVLGVFSVRQNIQATDKQEAYAQSLQAFSHIIEHLSSQTSQHRQYPQDIASTESHAPDKPLADNLNIATSEAVPLLSPVQDTAPSPAAQLSQSTERTPPTNEFWVYLVKKGDTVKLIAEWYYGKDWLYPVLLEHNPDIGMANLAPGTWIRILKDPQQAKNIYERITISENNGVYWYYTITDDNFLASFMAKFNEHYSSTSVQDSIIGNVHLPTGEKIKIKVR